MLLVHAVYPKIDRFSTTKNANGSIYCVCSLIWPYQANMYTVQKMPKYNKIQLQSKGENWKYFTKKNPLAWYLQKNKKTNRKVNKCKCCMCNCSLKCLWLVLRFSYINGCKDQLAPEPLHKSTWPLWRKTVQPYFSFSKVQRKKLKLHFVCFFVGQLRFIAWTGGIHEIH